MTNFNTDHSSDLSFCVYKITNKLNNKVYIGQTINKVKRRWQAHCSKRKDKSAISSAILLYGKDNFIFEVIDIAENREQLNHKECFWIKALKTLAPYGYNLNSGGNLNSEVSEVTRAKISAAVLLAHENDPDLRFRCTRHVVGTIRSPEQCLIQSIRVKNAHIKDPNLSAKKIAHLVGKPRSEEDRLKISKTLTGVKHTPERKIAIAKGMKKLDTASCILLARKRYKGSPILIENIRYETPYEVELFTGLPADQISTAMRRGVLKVKGVVFEILDKGE